MKLKFTCLLLVLAVILAGCGVREDVKPAAPVQWEYTSYDTTEMGMQVDASGVRFQRVWSGKEGYLCSVGSLATYLAKKDWELVAQGGGSVTFKRPSTSAHYGQSEFINTAAWY